MLGTDDEADVSDETDGRDKKQSEKRSPWVSGLVFVMGQSYVLSLIAMMVCGLLPIVNDDFI
jgi:hypothetical protein